VKFRAKHFSLCSFLVVGAALASSFLPVPQAWSLNESLRPSEPGNSVVGEVPSSDKLRSLAQNGFRPVPANRSNVAKASIDEDRNPFAVNASFVSSPTSSGNAPLITAGLNSLRLTGIVQEGSTIKALVEGESEYASLTLGDHISLGVFQGMGFRVSDISFETGTIFITNGREEHQISVQR